ncbi:MAG: response regulator, partial [Rhodospirillales bacterium]|nr:response regulator [Rhodospirillales bacterium]
FCWLQNKDCQVKIFIVDDDHVVIEVMTAVLESNGHEVGSNVSGEQVESDIMAMRPDFILTDLMIEALDGLELFDKIRQKKELDETKIIKVSTRQAVHWKEQAEARGVAGYITKPIDPAIFTVQLVENVESAG